MPFLRPGLVELRQQALSDLLTAPGSAGMGLLRRAISRALAWALGNLSHGLHGHLDWVARESVPYSATGEDLEAWAALVGVARKPAVAFVGLGAWQGAPGTPMPAGTPLSGPDGLAYVTTGEAVTNGSGVVTAPIAAVLTGTAGTMDVGEALNITGGVAGISGGGTLVSVTTAGVDLELDDPFRTRMLLRWATPPQGGAATDYVEWALAVSGVTRAWCRPNGYGPGTVTVFFMMDDVRSDQAGFPQGTNGVAGLEDRGVTATGDQLVLADALYPLRPATALPYVVAPAPYLVPFAITTRTLVPAATKALAEAALVKVFTALADPLGGVMDVSPFETAVAAVGGMPPRGFTITSPSVEFQAPVGSLPSLGAVTWTVATGPATPTGVRNLKWAA